MDTFFSSTTSAKWLISLSEFHPLGPIIFGKSWKATLLNHFIPILVSGALNWKLAGSTSGGLWCACSMGAGAHRASTVCMLQGNFFTSGSSCFGFTSHWTTFVGMNRDPTPMLYPVLIIHPWLILQLCQTNYRHLQYTAKYREIYLAVICLINVVWIHLANAWM